jgi:hypothetical protein
MLRFSLSKAGGETMLRLRIAGLAALCALAALAALGPATASATRLCSAKGEICPEAKRWLEGTEITGASTTFQIVTAGGNMNCNKSKIEGELVNGGGGAGVAVAARIDTITFAECSIMSTPCTTATDLLAPYSIQFAWASGLNGTMQISPGWEFICGMKLNCAYSAPNIKLTVTGSEAAEVSATNLTLVRQGSICTTTAKLNAIYVLSSPGPMYVLEK